MVDSINADTSVTTEMGLDKIRVSHLSKKSIQEPARVVLIQSPHEIVFRTNLPPSHSAFAPPIFNHKGKTQGKIQGTSVAL